MSKVAWRLPCGLCAFAVEVYQDRSGGQAPRAGESAYWLMQRHIGEVHGETCADCGRLGHDMEQVQPDGRYVCADGTGCTIENPEPAAVVGIGERTLFDAPDRHRTTEGEGA